MEFDCPLRLCDKTAVDVAVGRPPAADKTVALVVVVDDVVLMTLAVGKLASVAADTVAVGLMVRAAKIHPPGMQNRQTEKEREREKRNLVNEPKS